MNMNSTIASFGHLKKYHPTVKGLGEGLTLAIDNYCYDVSC